MVRGHSLLKASSKSPLQILISRPVHFPLLFLYKLMTFGLFGPTLEKNAKSGKYENRAVRSQVPTLSRFFDLALKLAGIVKTVEEKCLQTEPVRVSPLQPPGFKGCGLRALAFLFLCERLDRQA